MIMEFLLYEASEIKFGVLCRLCMPSRFESKLAYIATFKIQTLNLKTFLKVKYAIYKKKTNLEAG